MFKKVIFFKLVVTFFISQSILGMNQDVFNYSLTVQRPAQDLFKIEIDKKYKNKNVVTSVQNNRVSSFVANFADHTISHQQNMVAPFQLGRTTFEDPSNPDCFLWNIPDFGLLKIAREGSVCFGHESEEAPLLQHDLVFKTPGKLFLQYVKATALTLHSSETELCGATVTDRLFSNNFVRNTGGLKVSCIEGSGELLNEGIVDFNSTCPAIIGISKFANKKQLPGLTPIVRGSRVHITGQNNFFHNGTNAEIDIADELDIESAQLPNASFVNKGSLKCGSMRHRRSVLNDGFLQTYALSVDNNFINKEFGTLKILKDTFLRYPAVTNKGTWESNGIVNGQSSTVHNKGTLTYRQGAIANAKVTNDGALRMDNMTGSLDIVNDGTVELKNNTLSFKQLQNNQDLILHSGAYTADSFKSKNLLLAENNWTITDDVQNTDAHRLVVCAKGYPLFRTLFEKIECQKDVLYDIHNTPISLHAHGDINCTSRFLRSLDFLRVLQTTGNVIALTDACNLLKKNQADIDLPNIGHLELFINGPLMYDRIFKVPALSLHVAGPLTLGQSNQKLGTIAATHGPLTVDAHSIDNRFGKLYGKGKTAIQSTQGDIVVGAPIRGVDEDIKQQFMNWCLQNAPSHKGFVLPILSTAKHVMDYTVNQRNGSYIATDDYLTIQSAKNIIAHYGTLLSVLGNHFIAIGQIKNHAGKISTQGPTTLKGDEYNHTRDEVVLKNCLPVEYPGSSPAILESLQSITFLVKKVHNYAGSIRSGGDITVNTKPLSQATEYTEQPQTYIFGPANTAKLRALLTQRWRHDKFTQSCITQAGGAITMNLGPFAITGNMNAGTSTIAIQAHSGAFANTNLTRQTVNAAQPIIVDVTRYMQEQAQKPGILRLGAQGRVETEFPMGTASRPADGDMVLLENQQKTMPINWRTLFNPLSSINLNLYLQQLLGNLAGKVYAGNAKGNNLATVLWANANKWRQEHGTDVMIQHDLRTLNQSMLLAQILCNGATQQQQTLLCITPSDINPFQSPGDVVAKSVSCVTHDDQSHVNNRIVATDVAGINLQSTAGRVNLETQSYTINNQTDNVRTVEQCAMPQQQLIAPKGPVRVTAYDYITRTASMIAALTITAESQNGSVVKQPLVLKKMVEISRKKKKKKSIETTTTHTIVPSTDIATATLHTKAAQKIQATANQDNAGQEIIYEAPHTTIEGLIAANQTTSWHQKRGTFTTRTSTQSKQTPYSVSATLKAPLVRFVGQDARVNATIVGNELRDETEKGMQFVAKVAQMLSSGQTLVNSPLFSGDAGYKAMHETMIPPMLLVEKIIRTKDTGHMLFESVVMDKNRTQIIGKFVETTYQLKHWQTTWNHSSQLIPNEALVVVALAITLATQGLGVEVMGPMLQSITATTEMQLSAAGIAAVNAGFSTICSSLGASLLRTGDVFDAKKQLTSSTQLKSLTCNMLSAGLCSQLGTMLDINMDPCFKSLPAHMQEQTLRTTVDSLLNVAIMHTPVDAALSDAFKNIPLRAVASYASNRICASYMNSMTQKAAQTVVGGLQGLAMNQSLSGFAAGATGALTAEVVGEYVISDAHAIAHAAVTQLTDKEIPLTTENVRHAIAKEVQVKTNIAKIMAGAAAAVTGQNTSISIATASTAIDNDVAIRGSLYALQEFQSMVYAASKAIATLLTQIKQTNEKLKEQANTRSAPSAATKPTVNSATEVFDEAATQDFIRQLLEKTIENESFMQHEYEQFDQQEKHASQPSQEETPAFLKLSGKLVDDSLNIIKLAFVDAVNQTIDTFSIVPNPVGAACWAAGTARDIYQGTTTVGDTALDIASSAALTYGILKGIKFAKILYKEGKSAVKDITDRVLNRLHQQRYAAENRVPFVENPRAGTWDTATISEDLVAADFSSGALFYEMARFTWHKDPKAPFNVVAHGNPSSVIVHNQSTHPKGLSNANLLLLQKQGSVNLNAVQLARLIRTAPGYVKGQHINLISCECGAKSQGIAQQLATRLGVPVSAFTKIVGLTPFGTIKTYSDKTKKLGVMKTFYPNKSQRYRFVPLAVLSAFLLSGDEGQIQNVEVPCAISERYIDDLFEDSLE